MTNKKKNIMVYRFLLLSDEVDDFRREIKISSEASFLDLHKAIAKSVDFDEKEMCSFFICDDDWSKRNEITLVDMGAPSDEETYLMENTPLEELLEDEHQKLLYVFDYMTERAFFMELSEIITGKNLKKAVCSISVGTPPMQSLSPEDFEKNIDKQIDLGEDFYGDSSFNDDEFDSNTGSFDDDSIDNSFDERF